MYSTDFQQILIHWSIVENVYYGLRRISNRFLMYWSIMGNVYYGLQRISNISESYSKVLIYLFTRI